MPPPHLNNRSYDTAFPAPGKRLVMWVLKYFIHPIKFAQLKIFHNLPFFSLLHRFLLSLPHHLEIKKNEEPGDSFKKNNEKVIKFSKNG